MALDPIDETHALQIQAGTLGRKAGHAFEDGITEKINELHYPLKFQAAPETHLSIGSPAHNLLNYVASSYGKTSIEHAAAISTGALATSEDGKRWLEVNGIPVRRCKSDLILTMQPCGSGKCSFGISIKQCNNKTPTNAQLYFTTARGFASLLRQNGIPVSGTAVEALRQFCGDAGYRPGDNAEIMKNRRTDPRRYFWEEINPSGKSEWEFVFSTQQDAITQLLLQKAYMDDPFAPDFLLHKTKKASSWDETEVAIYGIKELIMLSRAYGGFSLKPYSVRKGSYKDPPGIQHLAPRFGIIQMQRGGQAQHPEQLQFNLEAGYFYKIQDIRPDMIGEGAC